MELLKKIFFWAAVILSFGTVLFFVGRKKGIETGTQDFQGSLDEGEEDRQEIIAKRAVEYEKDKQALIDMYPHECVERMLAFAELVEKYIDLPAKYRKTD